jgi:membrane protease subunit (stomatin/prohibitin family)
MSGRNNKGGLGGLLKTVNNATRTINNVQNTTNNVTRTANSVTRSVGGNKKKKQFGSAKANNNTWTCACGTANTTKFCGGCGKISPTEVACVQCGWTRTPENSGMKFCGECGSKFNE